MYSFRPGLQNDPARSDIPKPQNDAVVINFTSILYSLLHYSSVRIGRGYKDDSTGNVMVAVATADELENTIFDWECDVVGEDVEVWPDLRRGCNF